MNRVWIAKRWLYFPVMDKPAFPDIKPIQMASIFRTPKNIFQELLGCFRTSRLLQWLVLLAIIAVPYSCFKIDQAKTQRALEKSALEQNAKAEQVRIVQKAALEQAERDQKATFIKSLFYFPPAENAPGSIVLGIDARQLPAELRDTFVSQVKKQLSVQFPTTPFVTDVLLPDFYSKGYFNKAFSGDLLFLDEAHFFENSHTLLLVKPQIQFSNSSVADGMKSCRVTLILRKYQADHAPSHQIDVSTTGIGFSDETSMKKAIETMGANPSQELSAILK